MYRREFCPSSFSTTLLNKEVSLALSKSNINNMLESALQRVPMIGAWSFVPMLHFKAFDFAGEDDMHVALPADLGCGGL
jgi:hypothetical protein